MSLYDSLLLVHVLSAFALIASVVIFTAFILGAPGDKRTLTVANVLEGVGAAGTLFIGIWLAIYLDSYKLWDGWIIGSLVLYAIATETGRRAEIEVAPGAEGAAALRPGVARMHWLRTIAVLGILILMIYKPGA